MITEHMQLTTKDDARQWASDLGLDEDQIQPVADWIWLVKPYIGSTYSEHPIATMEAEEMLDAAGAR